MAGMVYVLTNAAMPGLVKIGMTDANERVRMDQLYTTGVPVPFDCAVAKRVDNAVGLERALHTAFGPNRVNPRREFFSVSVEQVRAIIDVFPGVLLSDEEAVSEPALPEESASAERLSKSRKPNMNWTEMGIPVGSRLVFTEGEEIAIILDERKVLFRGEEMYLTKATKLALGLEYSVRPTPYWTFEGRSIEDVYNETYVDIELD
jgi:T5orf172 domain